MLQILIKVNLSKLNVTTLCLQYNLYSYCKMVRLLLSFSSTFFEVNTNENFSPPLQSKVNLGL